MWMNVVVNSLLVGTVFAFVVWCVYETVVQYRFNRKMKKMEATMYALISSQGVNWAWRRKGYVWPLFHEQRRKE